MDNTNNKEKHLSYGLLAFSRACGGTTSLFGSSIKHSNTIRMYLRHGCVERTLHSDFYYTDGLIAEVEMSASQFAEAITSMNSGTGVPVTIKWLKGEGSIPECPFTDKREQFEHELNKNIDTANEDITELIKEVQELFNTKKALNLKEKTEIINKLTALHAKIHNNRKFIYNMFNEQMDKTVNDAKGEIEAFMQNKMLTIANNAIIENREALITEAEKEQNMTIELFEKPEKNSSDT